MPSCETCGDDSELAHTCTYCENKFCSEHQLPEAHDCRQTLTWTRSIGRRFESTHTQKTQNTKSERKKPTANGLDVDGIREQRKRLERRRNSQRNQHRDRSTVEPDSLANSSQLIPRDDPSIRERITARVTGWLPSLF